MGKWLRLSHGRIELVVHEDHVQRLLSEGAYEVPDPRLPQSQEPAPETEQAIESEQPDASTLNDGTTDQPDPNDDRRSRRRKPAVRRSSNQAI